MASSPFLSENQSFSESDANSSWATLIRDQVTNSIGDEDFTHILDFNSDPPDRSTSIETHGQSKQHVDMRTFEQILQVMIQQGAALDRLREELDRLRQERKQELEYRDARLRLAETKLRSLRIEKDKALAVLEELQEELGALKASEEDVPTSLDVLSMEEHNRIVLRIKDDARAQLENAEAEKSLLTLQLSRFQIQNVQLKNQVEDRNYPDEVVEDLTKTLRDTVIETCKNADVAAQEVKQELAATKERLETYGRGLEDANNARDNLESELAELKESLEELHAEYNAVQERLAISESMQGQANEESLKEAQEQVEQLQEQLSEAHKARAVALMDTEQLRTLLKEAEERRSTLASELQLSTNAFAQAEERLSELQKEHNAALSENEQLRSISHEPSKREATLTVEIEKLKQGLKDAEEQRERAERISKEAEHELGLGKEQNDELSKVLTQEQENLRTALARQSELEDEIQALKTSHEEGLAAKTAVADEASNKLVEVLAKLNEEAQRTSTLSVQIAEARQRLAERDETASVELEEVRSSLREAEKNRSQAENRLNEISKNLQEVQKGRSELEAQLKTVQAALEAATKRQSQVESELQQAVQSKDAELKDATRNLQAQIDSLTSSLASAKTETAKEVQLREKLEKEAEEGNDKHLNELSKLESELDNARKKLVDLQAEGLREQTEAKARQKQIDELQELLKQTKKGKSEVLRENERIRLMYADAEGNRAEADMLNEELQQKISELEEEAKRVPSLETDLRNTQAQLAQAMASMNEAEDQVLKYSSETTQLRTEIAELRAENEQLIAARRQMAAIYGLPAEPISSPRHTPTRIVPSTPVRRSSQSLSPSASSVATQWMDHNAAPPTKRRRVARLSIAASNSGGAGAGTSSASAIFVDDKDEHLVAPPTTPTHRDQNGTGGYVPKHLIDIYATFTKLASWHDDENRPVCGFCALHNHYNAIDRRAPLHFDPSYYPYTFWKHCLMVHKDALRPEIEAWLKAEGLKSSASEAFPLDDLPAVLAKFISWKKSETKHACGLCELEKKHVSCEPLNFDPSEPGLFWAHCRRGHVHFWKPVKQQTSF